METFIPDEVGSNQSGSKKGVVEFVLTIATSEYTLIVQIPLQLQVEEKGTQSVKPVNKIEGDGSSCGAVLAENLCRNLTRL